MSYLWDPLCVDAGSLEDVWDVERSVPAWTNPPEGLTWAWKKRFDWQTFNNL